MDTNITQTQTNTGENIPPMQAPVQPQYNTYPQAIYYPPMPPQQPLQSVDTTKIERLLEVNNTLQNAVLERQNDIHTMLQSQIRMQNISRVLHFIKTLIFIILTVWGIMSLRSTFNKGLLGGSNMLSNIQNVISEQPNNAKNSAKNTTLPPSNKAANTASSGNFITDLQRSFEKTVSKFIPPSIK